MTSLLNIGVSGLISHQTALTTVGNNISNANVEGYSRQEASFAARASQLTGSGYVGAGVEITTIRRVVNQFTLGRLQADISRDASLGVLSTGLAELDNLLADASTGLSTALDDLFGAIQTASESPTSLPLRQQVISEAERFVSRYQNLNAVLENAAVQVNENIRSLTSEVNQITASIAELNQAISETTLPNGGSPNDLLDQRDQLLRDLAQRVNFSTANQDGDLINVYLTSGQALVLGGRSNNLVTVDSEAGAANLDIAIQLDGGRTQLIGSGITGGELGGQLRYREEGIEPLVNELGLIATSATNALNVINRQGVDLDQQAGQDIFTSINDRAAQLGRVTFASNNSSSTAVASSSVTNALLLTSSDYRLDFEGAGSGPNYTITRLSDGEQVAQGVFVGLPQTINTSDGFNVVLESGSFVGGDSLTISPSRLPAENIEVLIQSPTSLAFGLPLSVAEGSDNQGTGNILQPSSSSIATVLQSDADGVPAPTTTPLLIRFTSSNSFDILDNSDPDNPVAFAPPLSNLSFTPGSTNRVIEANTPVAPGSSVVLGFDIEIAGVPQAGDEFTIESSFAGENDNRNALAFASLQRENILGNGASLTDVYAGIVSELGVASSSANIDSQAAQTLREQSEQRLQSESGVNLDEEAAKLLQYEQAYNASAQVISVARTIFDSLLAAFR